MEQDRQADLERRDALAERLKKKDLDKQRKIVERSDKKVRIYQFGGSFVRYVVLFEQANEEARKRLEMDGEDQKRVVCCV